MCWTGTPRGRLIRHDGRIVWRGIARALSRWPDRLTAAAALTLTLTALHGWAAIGPLRTIAPIMATLAGFVGWHASQKLARRRAWHGEVGLLAAEALRDDARRSYDAIGQLLILTLVALAACVASLSAVSYAVAGYAAALLAAALADAVAWSARPVRRNAVPHRRASGRALVPLLAAGALILAMAVLHRIAAPALAWAAVAGTLLATSRLSPLDHAVVRFESVAGCGPWRSVVRHTRAPALFVVTVSVAALAGIGLPIAAIVLVAGIGATVLLGLRILVHRLHPERTADWFVAAMVGSLALVAAYLPLLLPPVAAVLLWRLARRSADATWLIA